MFGYCVMRTFIMATHRAILTELTKADFEFIGTQRHQTAFQHMTDPLKSACIALVDWMHSFYLITEASGTALGGCLMSQADDGKIMPLRFMYRSLDTYNSAQENRERYMRVGVFCTVKSHSMLTHVHLAHRPRQHQADYTHQGRKPAPRARLELWLSQHTYDLQHYAGTYVPHADR